MFEDSLEAGITPLGTVNVWGQILVGDCPGHWRAVSSIPASYPPGFGRIPTHPRVVTTPNISRFCQMSLGGSAIITDSEHLDLVENNSMI